MVQKVTLMTVAARFVIFSYLLMLVLRLVCYVRNYSKVTLCDLCK